MHNRKPMSERGRQRVMLAASQVNPKTAREAAILGGIVRCANDTNHFDKAYVKHYVPQALAWFSNDLRSFGAVVTDFSAPTEEEIASMLKRFTHFYDPPEVMAAA